MDVRDAIQLIRPDPAALGAPPPERSEPVERRREDGAGDGRDEAKELPPSETRERGWLALATPAPAAGLERGDGTTSFARPSPADEARDSSEGAGEHVKASEFRPTLLGEDTGLLLGDAAMRCSARTGPRVASGVASVGLAAPSCSTGWRFPSIGEGVSSESLEAAAEAGPGAREATGVVASTPSACARGAPAARLGRESMDAAPVPAAADAVPPLRVRVACATLERCVALLARNARAGLGAEAGSGEEGTAPSSSGTAAASASFAAWGAAAGWGESGATAREAARRAGSRLRSERPPASLSQGSTFVLAVARAGRRPPAAARSELAAGAGGALCLRPYVATVVPREGLAPAGPLKSQSAIAAGCPAGRADCQVPVGAASWAAQTLREPALRPVRPSGQRAANGWQPPA